MAPIRSRPPRLVALTVLGLILMVSAPSTATASDRDEFQLWAALLGTAAIAPAPPSFALWLDAHTRRGAAGTTRIVRPGVGLEATPWLSLWAGYAWVPTSTDATESTIHEQRAWQQGVLKHRFDAIGVALQARTRFEQRFSDQGDDVGFRLRQFVRANWQPRADVPLGMAAWDELFVGLTRPDWGAPRGIDQNRVFLGPFLQIASWSRLEAGYLLAYLDRDPNDLFAHVLAINLFVSLRPAKPAP